MSMTLLMPDDHFIFSDRKLMCTMQRMRYSKRNMFISKA